MQLLDGHRAFAGIDKVIAERGLHRLAVLRRIGAGSAIVRHAYVDEVIAQLLAAAPIYGLVVRARRQCNEQNSNER